MKKFRNYYMKDMGRTLTKIYFGDLVGCIPGSFDQIFE